MTSAANFARLVARPVDRVHIAASTVPTRDELSALEGYAVNPGDSAMFAAFLGVKPMSMDELRRPLRYVAEDLIRKRVDMAVERGAVTFNDDILSWTPDGKVAAEACLDARAQALDTKWANSRGAVTLLVTMLTQAAANAVALDKPSSHIVDRALPTPNPTVGSQLWSHLAKIRRLRADCHAEAWAEFDQTAESVKALDPAEPMRKLIERRTNELNAPAWAYLGTEDQLRCLAALASLDGSGTPT